MPILRVVNGYRVFDQDFLEGTTVTVPEADAERYLAFRFQYAAEHLAVFEIVPEAEARSIAGDAPESGSQTHRAPAPRAPKGERKAKAAAPAAPEQSTTGDSFANGAEGQPSA
jgi:hypothetical protein